MHIRSLRQLFARNGTWAIYLSKHISEIREVVVDNVTRMMACGSSSMGRGGHGSISAKILAVPTPKTSIKPVSLVLAAVVASNPPKGGYANNSMCCQTASGNTSPSPCRALSGLSFVIIAGCLIDYSNAQPTF